MGSEVVDVSEVSEPLSGRWASQPVCRGSQRDRRRGRSSVQVDGPAVVPSLPPDICGDDVGAADGHHYLPPHIQK